MDSVRQTRTLWLQSRFNLLLGHDINSAKVERIRYVYSRVDYTQALWTVGLTQPKLSANTSREAKSFSRQIRILFFFWWSSSSWWYIRSSVIACNKFDVWFYIFAYHMPDVCMYVWMYVCMYIYQIAHNRAIRPCHPSPSMPLALILPRGDQWYLLRKPLIKRDKVCMYVCMFYVYF